MPGFGLCGQDIRKVLWSSVIVYWKKEFKVTIPWFYFCPGLINKHSWMGRVCSQHIHRIWRDEELHEDAIAHEYQNRSIEGSYQCTSSTRHALVKSFLRLFGFSKRANAQGSYRTVLKPQDGQVYIRQLWLYVKCKACIRPTISWFLSEVCVSLGRTSIRQLWLCVYVVRHALQ